MVSRSAIFFCGGDGPLEAMLNADPAVNTAEGVVIYLLILFTDLNCPGRAEPLAITAVVAFSRIKVNLAARVLKERPFFKWILPRGGFAEKVFDNGR